MTVNRERPEPSPELICVNRASVGSHTWTTRSLSVVNTPTELEITPPRDCPLSLTFFARPGFHWRGFRLPYCSSVPLTSEHGRSRHSLLPITISNLRRCARSPPEFQR